MATTTKGNEMRVEVDFAYDGDGERDDAYAVEAWREEYGGAVTMTIVGAANGWPVVAIEGDDDAVERALAIGGWEA